MKIFKTVMQYGSLVGLGALMASKGYDFWTWQYWFVLSSWFLVWFFLIERLTAETEETGEV